MMISRTRFQGLSGWASRMEGVVVGLLNKGFRILHKHLLVDALAGRG